MCFFRDNSPDNPESLLPQSSEMKTEKQHVLRIILSSRETNSERLLLTFIYFFYYYFIAGSTTNEIPFTSIVLEWQQKSK